MDTITAIFEYTRSALRPLFTAILQIVGPYIVVAAIASGLYAQQFSGLFGMVEQTTSGNTARFLVPMSVLYLALVISWVMLSATVYAFVRFADRERRYPDVAEVRTEMRGSIGMIIGSSILIVLILAFASLFLILPGIWMSVPLSLVLVIRVLEGLSFADAVKRAIRLVRDRWWWTFGILILCYLAQAIAGGLFSIPSSFLTMFMVITAEPDSEAPLLIQIILSVLSALSQIASLLFTTLILVATTAVYFAHVERLDATTLSQRVSDLAGGSSV